MVRDTFKKNRIGLNPHFNYRGEEQTRIEAFTDAVFAFAVTLLVLSSSVPETFDDLKDSFGDIIPFGLAIAILVSIWFDHYIFSIRYGFRDGYITMLNTILLFLVLIYVYPLKFLMSVLARLFYALLFRKREVYDQLFTEVIEPQDTYLLMIFYGLGVALIFGILAFMYRYALKKKEELGLNDIEIFETRTSLYTNLCLMAVPLLSSLVALSGIGSTTFNFILSGNIYMIYPILMPLYGYYRNKKKRKLFPNLL
ncbi:MAG: TMEM175 family protein [Cyclobacteriaceae bacterium]